MIARYDNLFSIVFRVISVIFVIVLVQESCPKLLYQDLALWTLPTPHDFIVILVSLIKPICAESTDLLIVL